MSELTKQALKVDNNQSFPNNNAGLITPSALRTFNENMIDSLLDEIGYNVDSASFNNKIDALSGSIVPNTGSLLTTASFDNNTRDLTFTKGDSSTFFVNIPDVSGSDLPAGLVSGSSQIDYSGISNIPAGIVSGSGQVISLLPSGVVSGSTQVLGGTGIVSSSTQIDYPQISNIPAGIVSSSAQVVGILDSVNTFTQSQIVYNDDNDTKWNNLGGQSGSFVTESETGSFARTNVNNDFGGNQTFNNINVNGTASIANINFVTGSATIIGDAFIVLNTDTPTLRYAGLLVIDSGSGGTASLQWDGDEDLWLVVDEEGKSSYMITGPTGSLGSEVSLITNSIPKAAVYNQLVESNISDDGSKVSINSNTDITGSVNISGNISASLQQGFVLVGNGSGRTSAIATSSIQSDISGLVTTSSFNTYTQSNDLRVSSLEVNSGSVNTAISNINGFTQSQQLLNPTFATTGSNTFTGNQIINGFFTASLQQGFIYVGNGSGVTTTVSTGSFVTENETGSFAITGSNTFVGTQTITGSLVLTGSISTNINVISIVSQTASLDGSLGNTFTLNLPSATDTRLETTNLRLGQTINLLVSQSATGDGTLTTAGNLFEPSGSEYSASQVANAQDLLTLATFFSSDVVYVAAVNNLI